MYLKEAELIFKSCLSWNFVERASE